MPGRQPKRKLLGTYQKDGLFRILSLDGGGAKGFYSLGVLKEIEGMLGCPLYQCFDLIFGTSTGAIIAALIALGYEVDEIRELYRVHVPTVMKPILPYKKTAALAKLAKEVFGELTFLDVKTRVGIVATKWQIEKPIIFKGDIAQAHGRQGTFVPGFGATIAKAVQASCSAYPFFKRQMLRLSTGDKVELADGGYCANNPTLYAIADATAALKKAPSELRVVSVGVGVYPPKTYRFLKPVKYLMGFNLLQKALEFNTQSMEQLHAVLFKDIKTVRVNDSFPQPEMATDLMEHDLTKLDTLWQRGRESFAGKEADLRLCLIPEVARGNP